MEADEIEKRKEEIIKAARDLYQVEGQIEVDDEAALSYASEGNPDGCYVQAWVWVNFKELKK